MSDTNKNRLRDAELDADLSVLGDDAKGDPKPARVGEAEAPGAGETPDSLGRAGGVDREAVGGEGPRQGSVEGVDETAAERDAMRDATS
ncbi:hypothetical protein [Aureimonas leprariae]|uniref:Uncharacterized protein n=1 Tax=Plantimonas leprariae TaxID=2615207 RepID=A0A7V7PNW4_9HYPH|nr:hypothetical protein [Aureimonas leprariae]KAB0679623.1 hypothetical protein F6X38_12435 [Aureimonas leprariae]